MKICPNCHKEFSDEINFCGNCGNKLILKPRPRFCGKCGNRLNPNDMFCGKCGARVNDVPVVRNVPTVNNRATVDNADPPFVGNVPKSFLKELKSRLNIIRRDIEGDPGLKYDLENIDKIFARIDSPLTVLVTGASSTGKSMFINALFGKKIAATGVSLTTDVIIKTVYGSSESITIHFIDGTKKSCALDAFKHISSQSSNRFEQLRQQIDYVEYALPTEILKHISIIDGAALNSSNQRNVETAERFVAEADAIILIVSARNDLTESDISSIRQSDFTLKPLLIVNQIDALNDNQSVENRIRDVQSRLKSRVQTVIGVSSLFAFNGKLNRKPDLLRASKFFVFERFLSKNMLPNAERYKTNSVVTALGVCIYSLASSSVPVGHLTELITYVQTFCFNPKLMNEEIANLFLGVRYMFEEIPGNDIDKAKVYLEKSASKGNEVAQIFLTLLYIRKENFAETKRWAAGVINRRFRNKHLQKLQAFIQYQLGTMYYEGKGTAVDKPGAVRLMKQSVEGGCREAKRSLGFLLDRKSVV